MKNSTIPTSKKITIYIISIIVFILLLFLLHVIINNSLIFPNPFSIITRFFILLGETKTYLLCFNTFKVLIISVLLSFIIGGIFGIIAGINKYIEIFLKPFMALFHTIPLVALILILMVIIGLKSAEYYASTILLIPIFYNGFLNGTKSINNEYIDVYLLDSKINIRVIYRVYLPLITANLRQALVDSLGLGIKIIVMAEFMCGVTNTLGGVLMQSVNYFDYEALYAYCFILIIIVLVMEFIPKIINSLYTYIKINYINNKEYL